MSTEPRKPVEAFPVKFSIFNELYADFGRYPLFRSRIILSPTDSYVEQQEIVDRFSPGKFILQIYPEKIVIIGNPDRSISDKV